MESQTQGAAAATPAAGVVSRKFHRASASSSAAATSLDSPAHNGSGGGAAKPKKRWLAVRRKKIGVLGGVAARSSSSSSSSPSFVRALAYFLALSLGFLWILAAIVVFRLGDDGADGGPNGGAKDARGNDGSASPPAVAGPHLFAKPFGGRGAARAKLFDDVRNGIRPGRPSRPLVVGGKPVIAAEAEEEGGELGLPPAPGRRERAKAPPPAEAAGGAGEGAAMMDPIVEAEVGVGGGEAGDGGAAADGGAGKAVMDSPLLIFACARAEYLRRALDAVYSHHPLIEPSVPLPPGAVVVGAPIVISQDGTNPDVVAVAKEYKRKFEREGVPLYHMTHENQMAGSPKLRGGVAYKALAVHYGWALGRVFDGTAYRDGDGNDKPPSPRRVVILEEDIEIASDFFSYFSALAPLLDSDETLLAVSAFNDNGKSGTVSDPRRLVRSDFFPGLGWMMTSRLWAEFSEKWPGGYWDDWMRDPPQRLGRHTIRPEISRTFHFGSQGGASNNWFGKVLKDIELEHEPVDWSQQDFGYLEENTFRRNYWNDVSNAHSIANPQGASAHAREGNVRVEYDDLNQFAKMAKYLGLMTDEKAGVPRTGYKGVVETRPHGKEGFALFVTPRIDVLRENFKTTVKEDARRIVEEEERKRLEEEEEQKKGEQKRP